MIELKGVSRRYTVARSGNGDDQVVHALRDVSLSIERGQTVALAGPSGSGKTTLLSILAGLLRPSEGAVRVMDQDIARLSEPLAARFRRDHVGFIFQDHRLIPGTDALENVLAPLLPDARPLRGARTRALAALDRWGLADRARTRVEKLSGGERQRVAIARATVRDPELVLADEPTAHLDAALTESFLAQLAALQEAGRTVVVASHDPAVVDAPFIDRVIHMAHGAVVDSAYGGPPA